MTIRAGILGTGWIATEHANALRRLPDVVLAGVASGSAIVGTHPMKVCSSRSNSLWVARTKGPDFHAIPTVPIGRRVSRHVLQDRRIQVLMSVQNWSPLVIHASGVCSKLLTVRCLRAAWFRSTATIDSWC